MGIKDNDPKTNNDYEFDPRQLDTSIIALPLLEVINGDSHQKSEIVGDRVYTVIPVIIDINLNYSHGRLAAIKAIESLIDTPIKNDVDRNLNIKEGIDPKSNYHSQYVFANLSIETIQRIARREISRLHEPTNERLIYKIWPDFEVQTLVVKSRCTVKADAAQTSFAAHGENIVWAVMDSGIDGKHSHFEKYKNLDVTLPLKHLDFTSPSPGSALVDELGHGTHVAGIIAGEKDVNEKSSVMAGMHYRDERNQSCTLIKHLTCNITGLAPKAKLLSLKVLDKDGKGPVSNLIAAINYIQEINGNGRHLLIHGVNMSVGYNFDPEWFACGQSPLCVEVNRLVNSGVVVIVAAGNTGYGITNTQARGLVAAGLDLTINDPGNAEMAITVGSTHRDMPHTYGVSYFSSKGPTGDGRLKPDLVAPGEKILSCAAGKKKSCFDNENADVQYVEDSGTSMAAPHVSGAIAAFLSIRREFIGQPQRVKQVFMDSATDLGRERYFQGRGLIDLMRAIQSI